MIIEAKTKGKCITRNGEFKIEAIRVDLNTIKGTASIGFVSSKLHRDLHAGATISAASMDQLALEWVKKRFPVTYALHGTDVVDALEKVDQAVCRVRSCLGIDNK